MKTKDPTRKETHSYMCAYENCENETTPFCLTIDEGVAGKRREHFCCAEHLCGWVQKNCRIVLKAQ